MNCERNMKIIDIISENRIDEGILGKVGQWLAKVLGKGPQAEAAEKLAAQWAKDTLAGKPLTKASQVVGKALAKDQKVIDAATKSSGKLVNSVNWQLGKQAVAGTVGKAGSLVNGGLHVTDEVLKWFARWQFIGKPIYDYNAAMKEWDEKLKNKEISQEQYDYVREKYLSDTAGRIAAGMATAGFIRGSLTPIIGGLRLFPKTEMAGNILSNLSRGATIYVLSWLNGPEGRNVIANIFAQGPIGDEVSPYLGGTLANWIDKLKGKAVEAEKQAANDEKKTAQPDAGQGAQATQTPQTPSGAKDTSNVSGFSSSPDKPMSTAKPVPQGKGWADDIDLPSNLERDPQTGQLRIKR